MIERKLSISGVSFVHSTNEVGVDSVYTTLYKIKIRLLRNSWLKAHSKKLSKSNTIVKKSYWNNKEKNK